MELAPLLPNFGLAAIGYGLGSSSKYADYDYNKYDDELPSVL